MTKQRPPRTDADGAAFAGSQLQTQLYVNYPELTATAKASADGTSRRMARQLVLGVEIARVSGVIGAKRAT
jgi:hypothetical protein